jgi:nucleotide-binding universal stress UspA family protein
MINPHVAAPDAGSQRRSNKGGDAMTRIQTLLAATDLSAPARHAVARAASVAAQTGARLILIHVINLGLMESLRRLLGQSGQTVEKQLVAEAANELNRLAVDMDKRYGVTADVHVATGGVLQEIGHHVEQFDADLLVMGARGAGFVRDLLIGSTTEKVIRKITRPLLVVKQMPHEPYRKVLVPVDFSSRSVTALNLAPAIAPESQLVLLNAFEAPFEEKLRYAGIDDHEMIELLGAAKQEANYRMDELLLKTGLSGPAMQRIVVHGHPTTCILEQEQEQDCDLIVIGKHGYGMVEELLLGSVTKQVLALASCDLLVADRSGA